MLDFPMQPLFSEDSEYSTWNTRRPASSSKLIKPVGPFEQQPANLHPALIGCIHYCVLSRLQIFSWVIMNSKRQRMTFLILQNCRALEFWASSLIWRISTWLSWSRLMPGAATSCWTTSRCPYLWISEALDPKNIVILRRRSANHAAHMRAVHPPDTVLFTFVLLCWSRVAMTFVWP